jgi:hypothetical protein
MVVDFGGCTGGVNLYLCALSKLSHCQNQIRLLRLKQASTEPPVEIDRETRAFPDPPLRVAAL